MRCTTCDELLPEDAVFCTNCGRQVATTVNTQPVPNTFNQNVPSTATTSYTHYNATTQTYSSYGPPAYTPQSQVQYGGYTPVVMPNSSAAVLSLIFGVLAWTLLPVIGAVIAVVTGHMARRDIYHAGGRIAGDGMAIAGLVLGYLQLVPFVIVGGGFFLLFLMMLIA